MIRVVNIRGRKAQANDYYIGRSRKGEPRNPLGNPFPIERFGRVGCINLFEAEFKEVMTYSHDTNHFDYDEVVRALNGIVEIHNEYGDVNLVCWCAPLKCHGTVIANYITKHMLKETQCQTMIVNTNS